MKTAAFIVLFGLLITGCGAAGDGAEKSRWTLTAGSHEGEVKRLNPHDRAWVKITHLLGVTHARLVEYAPDYTVVPSLARSWTLGPGGDSITFTLREDATWHDGYPVTSADVVFTAQLWKRLHPGSFLGSHLKDAEATDLHTATLRLTDGSAFYLLQSWLPINTVIFPKHIWESIEDPRERDDPRTLIGCGPFLFESHDPVSQTVVLRANPRYFAGKPAVERLVWRRFKSYEPMLLALRKGELDMLLEYYGPMPLWVLRDFGDAVTRVVSVPDMAVPAAMVFNFRKKPMDLKPFREAVACSIDYERILRVVTDGQGGKASRGFAPPAYRYFKSGLDLLDQDLPKAARLFDSLGYTLGQDGYRRGPAGEVLGLELLVMGGVRYPHLMQIAQLLAEQLKGVGIDARPLITEHLLADTRIFGAKDYDVYIGRFQPLDILAGCGTLLFADSPGNMGTCADPRLLALAEAFHTARNEEAMRDAAYALQDYYAEELPGIALYHADACYPYRSDRFEGWVPMSSGFANIWSWLSIQPARN